VKKKYLDLNPPKREDRMLATGGRKLMSGFDLNPSRGKNREFARFATKKILMLLLACWRLARSGFDKRNGSLQLLHRRVWIVGITEVEVDLAYFGVRSILHSYFRHYSREIHELQHRRVNLGVSQELNRY